MNLPELCIRRPVMTTLLTGALCLFGVMAFRLLPVSDLPTVDFPTIVVGASLPGATPETMASAVATVLEQQFSTIAGIDSMTSTSATGSTSITLQFTLDRNIDAAAQDVQAAIAAVQRRLPTDMPSPPSLRKTNPADQPVLYLALSSPTLPLSVVDEYAETMMAQRISSVDGVSQVQVYGAQKYALRVRLDPRLLASRGITLDEVKTALSTHNVNQPTGLLDGYRQSVQILASGQLANASEFTGLVVAYRNGAPVRLGELAQVIDSVQDARVANWFGERGPDGKLDPTRSIVLAVQKQPGVNTVEVVGRVRALMPIFAKQLPESVHLGVLRDNSEAVKASVRDVEFTLLLSIALVVLVIFIFLRSVWATIIPSVAIPMALLGTFVAMYFCGYSLDNLSLLALTLSVGFVVDDAIVMLENIIRYIEGGMGVREAAFKGSKEIGFTIMSMTLSLVAVFIPLMFMGGILGRLLHEFAVTITAAILVSGVVSLTLTPMLCSRFLKPHGTGTPAGTSAHGRLYAWSEQAFGRVQKFYERTLHFSLRHRVAVVSIAALMAGLTVGLVKVLPQGFIPTDDTGIVLVFTEAAQDISFEEMVRHQQAAAAIAAQQPYVDAMMSAMGGAGSATPNQGRIFMRLKPRDQRPAIDVIMNDLRKKLSVVPGLRAYPQIPPAIRIGGQLTKALYQFTLTGSDLKELYVVAGAMEKKFRGLPDLLADVNSDLQITSPQLRVDIQRDRAATLGITPAQIEDALYSAFGTRQVSTIYTPTNQYYVIMEVAPEFQRDTAALSLIYLRSRSGKLVSLDTVATLRRDVGPLTVNHLGQIPAVTISFNLKTGVSLGDATAAIAQLATEDLPPTVSYSFVGAAQAFAASLAGMGLLLVTAVIVIYIVLGILYEDFIHPLTILSGLPAASFGALVTLWAFRQELNIMGYVGVILLIGIVKKNAIMMVDFAIAREREQGKAFDAEKAIVEACLVRFRPIMMTTFAALAGAFPIALGLGTGSDSRRPLGLAVVGGLLVSQLLTLYITPVIFVYMNHFTTWLRHRRTAVAPVAAGKFVGAK
ncbi:MAG: hydrophobic/amphiphilic exporter-1 [Verrucomicrobia bacterium]|jgi:hydrophobe/amphiphile efflux-1 (HAE1) family protein|nr:MAG: hydrophobic/amphiphilic exporter-1 [Verrucomicrobiota bacterium]